MTPTPEMWRRAMLDRAMELRLSPAMVVEEFIGFVTIKVPPISQGEAKQLSETYPFSEAEILATFSRTNEV